MFGIRYGSDTSTFLWSVGLVNCIYQSLEGKHHVEAF